MLFNRIIRVHRKDSAFVYAILESLEGMTSYSTLPVESGKGWGTQEYRDLSLWIPEGFVEEFNQILEVLRKKVSIVELEASSG